MGCTPIRERLATLGVIAKEEVLTREAGNE